jgi:hypothetical protein
MRSRQRRGEPEGSSRSISGARGVGAGGNSPPRLGNPGRSGRIFSAKKTS